MEISISDQNNGHFFSSWGRMEMKNNHYPRLYRAQLPLYSGKFPIEATSIFTLITTKPYNKIASKPKDRENKNESL